MKFNFVSPKKQFQAKGWWYFYTPYLLVHSPVCPSHILIGIYNKVIKLFEYNFVRTFLWRVPFTVVFTALKTTRSKFFDIMGFSFRVIEKIINNNWRNFLRKLCKPLFKWWNRSLFSNALVADCVQLYFMQWLK